ncbi:MarR family winged helix-turn-helix transcriptional regulator [Sansalvadorimonas verongulae]|uniref:MarR family winged helix-turn-helix transcriptional regulator n=1 Tax=Sansalvadorimonas verongulae TaxID=2172824 RepID=UPI0018AD2029|nr:MarR family transcriptional regulator [Sansalvadorimonas verongulae]
MSKVWRTMDSPPDAQALTCNEYDYLKTVQILGNPRLSEIAEDLSVKKPSATSMIMRLEKQGMVQRSPCPEDRRASRISLTEKSQELLRHDDVFYASFADQIRHKLSEKDCNELTRLLTLAAE